MSKVQVDTIVDKDDISAPTFSKGAIVTGVCTATTFVGALTGNADTATTATTTSGNAGGLTGSPSITVTDVNATGVTTTGIATVTTSVVVGSAVTANADGVITAGVGTFGSIVSGSTGTFSGAVNIDDTTASTSTATGALIVDGGVGIAKSLNVAGRVNLGGKVQFTVASPQLEFNNGGPRLWSPSANTLTIHTGGGFDSASSERLRIGSSGEIGIGGANYGTSGQVLTSGGSGAAPSWADAGGVWTKLASNSATSGTVFPVTTNGLSSTYFYYKILFYLTTADGSGVSFGVDFTTDSGSTWGSDSSSNYRYSNTGRQSNSNMGMDGTETYGYFMGSNTKEKWYGEINIVAPDLTTTTKGALAVYSASQIDDTHDGALSSNVTYRPSSNYLQAITGVRLVTSGAVNYINWSLLASAL